KIPDELARLIPLLHGLECWEVSCGGAAGSTFQLALGEKVRLPVPVKKTKHFDKLPQFIGQFCILVWCAWRLDGADGPLTSWDDTNFEAGLNTLVGSRIESTEIVPPAWDMNINFSNSLCLRAFCDHVPGEPSFDGNWYIRTPTAFLAIGPGTRITIE